MNIGQGTAVTDTRVGANTAADYGRSGSANVNGVAVSASNRANRDGYRLTVISAGVSEHSATGRLGDAVAMHTQDTLHRHGYECDIQHIDLKDFAADIAVAAVNYHMTDALLGIFDQVTSSDALITATPVFQASYSGLFKSFWDILDVNAIVNMPVALVATGGSRRHALVPDTAMRPLFAFLRAIPTPTSLFAAREDWGTEALESRLRRTGSELATMAISGLRDSMTAADIDVNAVYDGHVRIPVQ